MIPGVDYPVRLTGLQDDPMEPYDVERVNDELDDVIGKMLDDMTFRGFRIPKSVNIDNIKNALWELIGDANEGAEFQIVHPQRAESLILKQ